MADHPIVNMRTFESMTLQGETRDIQLGESLVHVAAANDIARLKLIAQRDQDLVDLILLASGDAADVFLELMGRLPSDQETDGLRQLLDALRKEGL